MLVSVEIRVATPYRNERSAKNGTFQEVTTHGAQSTTDARKRKPHRPGAGAVDGGPGPGRIALIQTLIPVALEKVHTEVQADVERRAGQRSVREGRLPGHVRWTSQRGSIYLADQKMPLAVPRVRDHLRHQEVPLSPYERLPAPREASDAPCQRGLFKPIFSMGIGWKPSLRAGDSGFRR